MKLCVVSDIHGLPDATTCLSAGLFPAADIGRFALNDLCQRPDLTGEALHRHLFDGGGMEVAVKALRLQLEGAAIALGYSAGGTALWRAMATGGRARALFCVSSTRLRDETAIGVPNHVFFGAEDTGRPSQGWLTKVPDQVDVLPDVGHS